MIVPFMNKGKVKALELLMTMDAHAEIFGTLGEDTCEIDDVMDGVERFVCSLYGIPKDMLPTNKMIFWTRSRALTQAICLHVEMF